MCIAVITLAIAGCGGNAVEQQAQAAKENKFEAQTRVEKAGPKSVLDPLVESAPWRQQRVSVSSVQ